MRTALVIALTVGVGASVAACGSGSGSVVRPPTGGAPRSTSALPSSSSSQAPVNPQIQVVPAKNLSDGQKVQVRGSGFSAGEALQIIQCADKGQATGPGDCNLTGMLSTTSDSQGRVAATLTVLRGPFGANGIVCSTKQHCLVSVTQASLKPTEEADAPISFAPR